MNSTAITSFACQNSLLNEATFDTSDELMLEELERRDGIYSFIFHELETPKTVKTNTDSQLIQNSSIRSGRRNSLSTTNTTHKNAFYKKVEYLSQQLDVENFQKSTAITIVPAATAITTAIATTATAATTTNTTMSSSIVSSTTKESSSKLPTQSELYRYQQYLKTWYPPPPPPPAVPSQQFNFLKSTPALAGPPPFYLDKRQSNLYTYMMSCGVSVRAQPPRFSHITEPMVRNRRHALKDSDAYKQRCTKPNHPVPDLRALFPHDPDVHAPFLKDVSENGDDLKVESSSNSDVCELLAPCSQMA